MNFDVADLPPGLAYKLLTATIVPRPIGWVSTIGPGGAVNLAPFSFFNAMGGAPPVVALGLMRAPAGGRKDTARNIADQGEFVVNLVSEDLLPQMSMTSAPLPPEESELEAAGLTALASVHIAPPRLAESPVSFECRTLHCLETGPDQILVVGSVLAIHVADRFVLDAERGHIDTPALGLVARMHGAGWYARSSDLVQLDRPAGGGRL
ncbi:flavin reductase family protein [Szabonella alba]|uniref:Flavin reductase family protein n=1 Tax=Szabonella alba TaxID=2804194 RepID=A0A8K0V699_9RHOB|nr:flavin reductase family protein [Szabonella alba]MBL4916163.1 flavin reductase family protein [Szabonella alba]